MAHTLRLDDNCLVLLVIARAIHNTSGGIMREDCHGANYAIRLYCFDTRTVGPQDSVVNSIIEPPSMYE